MAILTFAITKRQFLQGKKTVTRRDWADRHFEMWVRLWETGRRTHDAWDNIPIAGGKPIGRFRLTARPYREMLKEMPLEDLEAEGGMCSTIDQFCGLLGKSPEDFVSVLRFERI